MAVVNWTIGVLNRKPLEVKRSIGASEGLKRALDFGAESFDILVDPDDESKMQLQVTWESVDAFRAFQEEVGSLISRKTDGLEQARIGRPRVFKFLPAPGEKTPKPLRPSRSYAAKSTKSTARKPPAKRRSSRS